MMRGILWKLISMKSFKIFTQRKLANNKNKSIIKLFLVLVKKWDLDIRVL